MAGQTINGKAFEYACLESVARLLKDSRVDFRIDMTPSYNTAKSFFDGLTPPQKERYLLAANTATKTIAGLEPQLLNGKGRVILDIQPDSAAVGPNGDVRDVLFMRKETKEPWEVGISCKHNHEALKHPRITESKDFGLEWIDVPCSTKFIDEITPITDEMDLLGSRKTLWNTVPNKFDRFYVPILNAYLKEIQRLCNSHKDIPEKLLSYFFGVNDFYKIIMKESQKTTTVEGFNMHGTLNVSVNRIKPTMKVPVIHMPKRLLNAEFKEKSKTTIILTFDNGWSISMRLHNKDKEVSPTSLAWDVKLVGLPPSTYVNTRSWYD